MNLKIITGFLDVCDKYDEEFFKTHTLALIVLEEGSGSVRHKVTGLKMEDKLQVSISQIIPEVGTCDMAEWHIILELSKDSSLKAKDIDVIMEKESSEKSFIGTVVEEKNAYMIVEPNDVLAED